MPTTELKNFTSSRGESSEPASPTDSTRRSSRSPSKTEEPGQDIGGTFGGALDVMAEVRRGQNQGNSTDVERIIEQRMAENDGRVDPISVLHRGDRLWSLAGWLEMVFSDGSRDIGEKIDLIFELVDSWLLEERFEEVDKLFALLEERYMEQCLQQLDLSIGFLPVSNGAQDELEARSDFFETFQRELRRLHGKQEAEALVGGLG